ncbi:DUF5906 domain-containing protein [Laspinema sp. D1]|nr:DUF5906 domain-containing protein [Laspinema sp. D2b]
MNNSILSESTASTSGCEGSRDRQLVDLSQYADRLTPTSKGKYECPVCGGKNLSYSRTEPTKFKCFSGDCDSLEILKAIAPERFEKGQAHKTLKRSPGKKAKPAPIPESGALARLPEKPTPSRKHQDSKGKHTTYTYSETQWVIRLDPANGNRKRFTPHHINEASQTIAKKGDKPWPLYKEEEAIAEGSGKWILWAEGEKCTEALRWLQLVAIAFMGGANRTEKESAILRLQKAGIAGIARIRDNDKTGFKKSEEVANICHQVGMPTVELADYLPILEGKDIADLIKANLNNPEELIKQLERAFGQSMADTRELVESISQGDDKPKEKPPTPRELAIEIAEKYQPYWKYHNEQKVWRQWTGKCWESVEEEAFGQDVFNEVESRGINYSTDRYIQNVIQTLKRKLLQKEWQTFDLKRFIPFNNCVVDIQTGEIHEHSPGMGFFSFIPRDWCILQLKGDDVLGDLASHCPNTFKYLSGAMRDDPQKILKLIAVINAVVKWRLQELQMFVHLVGEPGAGKGTFVRLLQKIVGKGNFGSATLTKLDQDYTIADIIDKQLVICPDEDRKASGFGGLKALTGGDSISYRQIYKKPASSPFYGSLIVVSNRAIFAGDTTGLDRRLCLIDFDRRVPDGARNHRIEDDIDAELGALTAIALSLSDDAVTQLIRGIGGWAIPEFRSAGWKLTLDTNSVALHLDDCLVPDPNAFTPLATLYQHYREFCSESGTTAMARQRYSQELVALANQRLGWPVEHGRRAVNGLTTRGILGLRVRNSEDFEVPTPSESFEVGWTARTAVDGTGQRGENEVSTYENKGFSHSGQQPNNSIEITSVSSENQLKNKTPDETVNKKKNNLDENAVQPSKPLPSQVDGCEMMPSNKDENAVQSSKKDENAVQKENQDLAVQEDDLSTPKAPGYRVGEMVEITDTSLEIAGEILPLGAKDENGCYLVRYVKTGDGVRGGSTCTISVAPHQFKSAPQGNAEPLTEAKSTLIGEIKMLIRNLSRNDVPEQEITDEAISTYGSADTSKFTEFQLHHFHSFLLGKWEAIPFDERL